MSATLGVPHSHNDLHQYQHQATGSSPIASTSQLPPLSASSLRLTRSTGYLRSPHSSGGGGEQQHDTSNSGSGSGDASNDSSIGGGGGHSSGSMSMHMHHAPHHPPDLSFSRSSLISDEETQFLNRPGGGHSSIAPYNQPYLESESDVLPRAHAHQKHQIDQVRIVSGSREVDSGSSAPLEHVSSSFPYAHQQQHDNNSWGSRHSQNKGVANNYNNGRSSSSSRIRLDSVFGTQLPGFPYLNSAAAATSNALGHPISSSYPHIMHPASHSSADLLHLRGRSSYNWSERSASAASHYNTHTHGTFTTSGHGHRSHSRTATSNSTRSVSGRDSATSLSHNAHQQQHHHRNQTIQNQNNNRNTGSSLGHGLENSECSAESNSSDEVDLDLSFDMDVLKAKQMQQQSHQQQKQQLQQPQQQQQQTIEGRTRAISSSGGSLLSSTRPDHVGIDMQHYPLHPQSASSAPALSASLGLPSAPDNEAHRRYMLGGRKRMSRSAVELRAGGGMRASSSSIHAASSHSSTPRGPTPAIPNVYRHSAGLPPSSRARSNQSRDAANAAKSSTTSLDLTVDIGHLVRSGDDDSDHELVEPPSFIMNESSGSMGWSFATTPPLSPAEIVTFAEGNHHHHHHHRQSQRRHSAGASGVLDLEHKTSTGNLLRKRRPSFPLMSLFDKAIRAPVAGIVAGVSSSANNQSIPSPETSPLWGSPTPVASPEPTMAYGDAAHAHDSGSRSGSVPLVPLPSNILGGSQQHYGNYNPRASLAAFTSTPDDTNQPLPLPPPRHDPALLSSSSPGSNSSIGTPGTLSPDLRTPNSGFSSPRSPDQLATPRTGDYEDDHNRYSQFSMTSASIGGLSVISGIEAAEDAIDATITVANKRDSKPFGMVDVLSTSNNNLDAIPEQSDLDCDSPRKSCNTSRSRNSTSVVVSGSERSPTKVAASAAGRPQSASLQNAATIAPQQPAQHKRQSSSLFRFPFVSSLRNPFAAAATTSRPETPSTLAEPSPHNNPNFSPSSSEGSTKAATAAVAESGSKEVLSAAAIQSGIARKISTVKRANSPSSSEESHLHTPSDPPSPPRPGATTQASAGIDPSMLREGPQTGKGRLSGLGLSFPSVLASSQRIRPTQAGSRQDAQQHPHAQRPSSPPILSFSAASDDNHGGGGRSVESEEAAIQVISEDDSSHNKPQCSRNSSSSMRQYGHHTSGQARQAESPSAITVHFVQPSIAVNSRMDQPHNGEFGANQGTRQRIASGDQQQQWQTRRPRTRLLSHPGSLDLRGRIDRMRPSQLLFLAAFIAGPWCFVLGGWCLRSLDGDYTSVKGFRCRCPSSSSNCECQAEIYRQIKLSGGKVDRVLQSQNGETRKLDRFVLANRIAALTCGTGTLVLAITALIVLGRTW